MPDRATIDLAEFEAWIMSVPDTVDVHAWRYGGLDLWPLFKTSAVGLAILTKVGQRKFAMPTGGLGWQAGVLFDYFARAAVGAIRKRALPPVAPREGLAGSTVYFASGWHARDLGEFFVTPSMDVVAALLQRAGHRNVFWYELLGAEDPRLARTLHQPGFGLAGLLSDARARALRFGTRKMLREMPGLASWCAAVAARLQISASFLLFWLGRQANLSVAVARAFEEIFERFGVPRLLLISNSCTWSTAGLAAAAKKRSVPVIDVHHGVECRSAITAIGQRPHFSRFNSAPDALVSWETDRHDDDRVCAAGPLGLMLPNVTSPAERAEAESYAGLRALIGHQRAQLARHVNGRQYTGEVLVSLQPGDDGRWFSDVVREMPDGVFFWIRSHGMDRAPANLPGEIAGRSDCAIASSSLLSLLLERVDVHLTRFSGVTLEAAAMGVPTVATEPYAAYLYELQLANTAIAVAQKPRAIAALLQRAIAKEWRTDAFAFPAAAELTGFVERFCPAAARETRPEALGV